MAGQIIRPSDGDPAGLGNVPTIGGDVTTAIPNPVTGVSAVQTQQSATTAAQAVAQTIVLPPIPYAVIREIDPSGALTMWLQTLVRKLGGYTATPSDDAYLMGDENIVDTFSRGALGDLQLGLGDTPSVRPAPDTDAWTGIELAPLIQRLMAQVDELTVQVQAIADRGWNQQPAQIATVAAAPAGGVGAAAGAWDTAAHRDTAIALLNNLKTRMDALETKLQTVRILT